MHHSTLVILSHAQNPRPGMLQAGINLVLKLVAIYACATTAGAGRITCLEHEGGDDAVEYEGIIVAATCEGFEVFASLEGVRRCSS